MRVYIKLNANKTLINYNYQELLTGVIHKWLGEDNEIHGKSAKICFSWLQNTKADKNGIRLTNDSYFFIGAYNTGIVKRITKGVIESPEMFNGVSVKEVILQEPPIFKEIEHFPMASPIFLKRNSDNKHLTYKDEGFDNKLLENCRTKLEKAGIGVQGFEIELDPDNHYRETKLVTYKGIGNKATVAPVVIKGNQEQIEYLWSVGLGHSTGIGFGALK